ncbi:MAG: leucine-rich repeat domain-containing protein, partial [Promethearchaeota archaeon]
RRILKDEIGRRIDSGNEIVIKYLIKQNFLDLLDNEEFLSLLYDSNDKLKDHFQNIFVDRRNFEDFVVPLLLKIITLDEKNIFQSYRSFGSNLICQLLYQFQELYKKYRASNLKNWIPYKKIVEYLGRFNTNLKLKCFRGVLIPPSEVSLLKEIERQIYYPFNKSHGRFKQVKEFAYNPQKAQDWKFNIEYIWGEEDAQFVVHNNHVETVAFRDINECGVCYNKDEGWYPDLDECNKCGLEYIPESLKSMNYLKNLFIYGSREHFVLDFPKMSNELKDLSLLLINGIWIRDIENLIDKLPALKALDLSKNNLESIPNNIYHLNSLEYLIMDKNKIKIFSELIGNLRSLRLLSLSKNLIAYLPKSIGNLQFLEILNLSYNNINSLPDSIGNLNSLKLLDLSYNHIDSFPKSLDKINSLKKVILKGNNLTEIPKSNFEIIT